MARKRANVFEQLGFSAEECAVLMLKTRLLGNILDIVKAHGYSQKELGQLLGQKQPHVSDLLNAKLGKISIEKLVDYLDRLGAEVSVRVRMRA